jgi:hypothetical protein
MAKGVSEILKVKSTIPNGRYAWLWQLNTIRDYLDVFRRAKHLGFTGLWLHAQGHVLNAVMSVQILDAAKRAGENRLADVNTFWGSNQFQMFNEKYENFKSNSKVKRVKPLGVLKFSEIFDIYTLSINRDVVLKNIKPTYRKEFSEWYFPKYEIQKTYFELIKKELQKPD